MIMGGTQHGAGTELVIQTEEKRYSFERVQKSQYLGEKTTE